MAVIVGVELAITVTVDVAITVAVAVTVTSFKIGQSKRFAYIVCISYAWGPKLKLIGNLPKG